MKEKQLNLFIVDDNELLVTALKTYLIEKFGDYLKISVFYDGDSCLRSISENTDVVILDYNLIGNKDGLDVLKEIKFINPKTEVIMLSSNENIGTAIDSFRLGAKDYVVKGYGSWQRIAKLIKKIINAPIRVLVKEFGVSVYVATFLITFIAIGIIVLIVSKIIN